MLEQQPPDGDVVPPGGHMQRSAAIEALGIDHGAVSQ